RDGAAETSRAALSAHSNLLPHRLEALVCLGTPYPLAITAGYLSRHFRSAVHACSDRPVGRGLDPRIRCLTLVPRSVAEYERPGRHSHPRLFKRHPFYDARLR